MSLQAHAGPEARRVRYRNFHALAIPDGVAVPTCGECHHWLLDPKTRGTLAPVLAEEYRRVLRQRVRLAIDTVCRHISQRQLELLLGLSQGYLS